MNRLPRSRVTPRGAIRNGIIGFIIMTAVFVVLVEMIVGCDTSKGPACYTGVFK